MALSVGKIGVTLKFLKLSAKMTHWMISLALSVGTLNDGGGLGQRSSFIVLTLDVRLGGHLQSDRAGERSQVTLRSAKLQMNESLGLSFFFSSDEALKKILWNEKNSLFYSLLLEKDCSLLLTFQESMPVEVFDVATLVLAAMMLHKEPSEALLEVHEVNKVLVTF